MKNISLPGCVDNAAAHPSEGVEDLTGKSYGLWVVLWFSHRLLSHSANSLQGHYWQCECKCGKMRAVAASSLVSGMSKGCGACNRTSRKHGKCETVEFRCWGRIKTRCYNSNHQKYARYGGRGIKMCSAYRASFNAFLVDVGLRPSSKHSIDRIDNDGHYSCGKCDECIANGWKKNCQWSIQKAQCRNKSNNRVIEFEGKKLTVAGWAELKGLPMKTLHMRLQAGWELERALNTSVLKTWSRQPRK